MTEHHSCAATLKSSGGLSHLVNSASILLKSGGEVGTDAMIAWDSQDMTCAKQTLEMVV